MNNMNNIIKINDNQLFYKTNISNVINNLSEISYQRDIDSNRIAEIVDCQLNYYNKYNEFHIMGVITIVSLNDKKYCIDGQHRLNAYSELLKNNQNNNIEIVCNEIIVQDFDEIRNLFKNINKCVSVPDYLLFEENRDKQMIIRETCKYFFDIYNNYFTKRSNSKRKAYRPNLRKHEFEDQLFHLSAVDKVKDSQELINKIENINKKYCNSSYDDFFKLLDFNNEIKYGENYNKIKIIYDKAIQKKNKKNEVFLLGLFPDYTWINEL